MSEPAALRNRRAQRVRRRAAPRSFFGRVGMRLLGSWGARVGLAWVGVVAALAIFAPVIASSYPLLWREPGGAWTSPLLNELTPTDAVLLWLALSLGVTAWFGSASRPLRLAAALASAVATVIPAWWFVARRSLEAARASGDGVALGVVTYWVGGAVVLLTLVALGSMLRRHRGVLVASVAMAVLGAATMLGLRIEPSLAPVYSEYREAVDAALEQQKPVPRAVWAPIPYSPNDSLSDRSIRDTLAPGYGPTQADVAERLVRDVKTLTDDLTPTTDIAVLVRGGNAGPTEDATQPGHAAPSRDEAEVTVEEVTAWAWARADAWAKANPRERSRLKRLEARIDTLASTRVKDRLHVMGTTVDGQDLASRMVHACRIALAIGFVATGIAVVIGVIVGGAMGYFSGWVDLVGMRLVEIFASIPTIFLLITIVAVYGRDLYLMMAVIGLTGWIGYALFVRAEFLKLRKAEYVDAARAGGAGLWRIWLRHMLPNGVTPLLISASFGVASAILTEATLSFLGLGLVNEPSWGQMLQNAREGLAGSGAWWIAVFPILAIFLTVFAYNLIGEALRDALDPKSVRPGG